LFLLEKRHREALVHIEMVGGNTTAAVINYSMMRPEKGVSPLDFMPNHRSRVERTLMSEEDEQAMSDFNLRVLIQAAKLKANNG